MKKLIALMLAMLMVLAVATSCTTAYTNEKEQGGTSAKPGGESDRPGGDASGQTEAQQTTQAPIDPKLVTELTLNHTACVVYTDQIGSFEVTARNGNGDVVTDAKLTVSLADAEVASVTVNGNALTVTPKKSGRTEMTVTSGDATAVAPITVLVFQADSSVGALSDAPENLSNITLYQRYMLENPGLSKTNAQNYAAVMESYADIFSDAEVSMLVAPKSSILFVDDPAFGGSLSDQTQMIQTINGYCSDRINTVDTCSAILANTDDYLFFHSDHHWTSLGAYYAYAAYARSIGLEPAPISSYNVEMRNDLYQGTLYSFSGKDARTKQIYDTIFLYSLPNKTVSMTITNKAGGSSTYASCFMPGYQNYLTYIGGDNPVTVITVAENDPDKVILVLKDSFGCCYVPYLTEYFGTIVVVDPREVATGFTIQSELSDYHFSDVLFVTSIFNPSVASWVNHCKRVIGQ